MIEVVLSAAVICFGGACYPALVGRDTPRGLFTLSLVARSEPQYGGDVLAFHEDAAAIFAVHRPPSKTREVLLRASSPARRVVTSGCVNVADEVYAALRECCVGLPIDIR